MDSSNKNKHSSTKKNSPKKSTSPAKNNDTKKNERNKIGQQVKAAQKNWGSKFKRSVGQTKKRKSPSSPKKPSPVKTNGSIVILCDPSGNVLLGEEGIFYFENSPTTKRSRRYIERDDINLHDMDKRKGVTKELYDELKNPPNNYKDFLVPLVEKSKTLHATTRGRYIYESFPRKRKAASASGGAVELGAPKGSTEGSEKPAETARRELLEEVGINLPIHTFNPENYPVSDGGRTYAVFKIDISAAKKIDIEKILKDRYDNGIGEMFDLKFLDPKTPGLILNKLTKDALTYLNLIDKEISH
jgi:8-oxo-dGTP pyrophosphatase MutT (NUDIX family)